MSIDKNAEALQKAKAAIEQRSRRYATWADVLAVAEHESGGVAIFNPTDRQFRDNLAAAAKITGLTKEQIIKAATINNGALKGKIAKFRCEPGYWSWAKTLPAFTPEEKFLLSCSFGVGQQMTRWLVAKTPKPEWISLIHNFMGNVSLQMLWIAGQLDALMVDTKGDKTLAFARYNGGPAVKTPNAAPYKNYGIPVAKRARELEQFLAHIEAQPNVHEEHS